MVAFFFILEVEKARSRGIGANQQSNPKLGYTAGGGGSERGTEVRRGEARLGGAGLGRVGAGRDEAGGGWAVRKEGNRPFRPAGNLVLDASSETRM